MPKSLSPYPSLKAQLLISTPALVTDAFAGSVVLVCEHDHKGALGIVINRTLDLTMSELMTHLDLPDDAVINNQQPILAGGPVRPEQGFVLHNSKASWSSTLALEDQLSVTTSRDILEAVSQNHLHADFIVALGYAGWEAGQLESELAQNYWLTVPLSCDIIFATPTALRWQAATKQLGFNLAQLSPVVGHC